MGEQLDLLLAMAADWTDPVVVRDAPERVPHVIEQLIDAIRSLRAENAKFASPDYVIVKREDILKARELWISSGRSAQASLTHSWRGEEDWSDREEASASRRDEEARSLLGLSDSEGT